MGQIQRQWHVIVGFVGGIAEHHALVTRTLGVGFGFEVLAFCGAVYALIDVRALVVNGRHHTARIGLEHILALGIANFTDDFAGDFLNIEVSAGLDLTG